MRESCTLLHWAAGKGDVPMLSLLLMCPFTGPEDVNSRDDQDRGNTPLHVACERGQSATTRILLDHPYMDVNCRRSSDGFTPLMVSIISSYSRSSYYTAFLLACCRRVDPNVTLGSTKHLFLSYFDCDRQQNRLRKIEIKISKHATSLHLAAFMGFVHLVACLSSRSDIHSFSKKILTQNAAMKTLPWMKQVIQAIRVGKKYRFLSMQSFPYS